MLFLTRLALEKPLTVWITINCGKFFKRWEYQTTWLGRLSLEMLHGPSQGCLRTLSPLVGTAVSFQRFLYSYV